MKLALIRLSTFLFLFFSFISLNLSNATPQEAAFLSNVAKQYMLAQFPNDTDDKKYIVKAGKLDSSRDYGGKCTGFLTAELVNPNIKKSNIVKITCSRKEKPYSVNVPVNVSVFRKSLVASDNIPKGSLITDDLLEIEYVNENTNTASSITDKAMIIGAKSRKDIKAGDQIKISDFCVIAKGDLVTIEAVSKGLSIKTQGQALEEGKLNDLIQVRNTKTKKIIQAVVVAPGTVQVIF